ncbi:MAG TPA: TPM domain-containing protein, partial [Clostridium sp.]
MRSIRVLFNKCTFHMFLALTLLLLLSFTLVNAESRYPKPTDLKYINDYTSTLDSSTKEYIISVGKELEDKTGAQEVVVVIDSLNGSDIATYANELFRTWGIGQKDKNNGLLVLVSIKEKKWRVEVGTSLEGAVTDIYSARVMDSVATPKFKE